MTAPLGTPRWKLVMDSPTLADCTSCTASYRPVLMDRLVAAARIQAFVWTDKLGRVTTSEQELRLAFSEEKLRTV